MDAYEEMMDSMEAEEMARNARFQLWWDGHHERLNGVPTPTGRNHIGGTGMPRRTRLVGA